MLAFGVLTFYDYDHLQRRLHDAAACNGAVTAKQLEQTAKAGAARSGLSVFDAENAMIILACPGMAR